MRGRTAAFAWFGTRVLVLAMLFTYAADAISDVNYYRQSLDALSSSGIAHTLLEYPLPAVAVVAVPWVLTGGAAGPAGAYNLAFLLLALATDAAFTAILVRWSPRKAAPMAWLLLVPALGAMTYLRFDLVPGLLVALALLLAARQRRGSAVAVAVATAVKLWPVLLVPAIVGASRRRWQSLLTLVGVGAVMAVATVILGGWARLFSPLIYQRDRGLQIEAVTATPAMVWHLVDPSRTRVWFAPSRSWEIDGSGVPGLLLSTTLMTAALGTALLAAWLVALRRPAPLDKESLVWLSLASVSGFVILGRVLSPQYLLWLAPLAAGGLVLAERSRGPLVRWTVALGVAAVLTNVLYPAFYRPLLELSAWSGFSFGVLALRNLILVGLFVQACRMALRSLAHGPLTGDESTGPLSGRDSAQGVAQRA